MFFWFKKKKIVLDCFTQDKFAYEYCKIDKAVDFYPRWWQDLSTVTTEHNDPPLLDKSIFPVGTMKICKGFTSLYTNSFIIPSWEEVRFEIYQGEWKWQTNRLPHGITNHLNAQFKNFVDPGEYLHFKFNSPWHLKTNRFVNFAFIDPVWNRKNLLDYVVLPGVVDFKYQPSTSINIMVKNSDILKTIDIHVGDPLLCITPLTDDKVELRHHYVEPTESLEAVIPSLGLAAKWENIKRYSQRKKFIDKLDEKNKQCPFGFGKK
jgi:hypothetical protein